MTAYPDDFFKLNRWILITAGLWEPKGLSKIGHYFYRLYNIYLIFYVYFWYVTSEWVSIADSYEDLYITSRTIYIGLTHTAGAIKSIFFTLKGDKIIKLTKILENKNLMYDAIDNFDPGRIVQEYKQVGIRCTMFFYAMGALTILTSFVPPIIQSLTLIITEKPLTNSTLYRRTPFNLKIPFSYDTPVSYLCMILYESIPFFNFQHSIIGADCLFMNIMNFIACHFEILQGAFRTVKSRCVKMYGKKLLEDECMLEILMIKDVKRTIKHLQVVIQIANQLEMLHRYITLAQMLTSAFVLCCCLVLFSMTSIKSKEFSPLLAYMIAMFFQLGIYCAFGNKITLKGIQVANSFYESEWIERSASYKGLMILTMMRMQKPISLTIGKFAPLTLTTYVAIIKMSYSYFALLKKMNDKS